MHQDFPYAHARTYALVGGYSTALLSTSTHKFRRIAPSLTSSIRAYGRRETHIAPPCETHRTILLHPSNPHHAIDPIRRLENVCDTTDEQPEYFGQYGDIAKLVINHHQGVPQDDPRHGSASAYVTFRRQEDAWAAICSVDGFRLMGRTIRASFGTTKYCNSFLRNLPCNNPDCLYLHELGDEGDRFTKVRACALVLFSCRCSSRVFCC